MGIFLHRLVIHVASSNAKIEFSVSKRIIITSKRNSFFLQNSFSFFKMVSPFRNIDDLEWGEIRDTVCYNANEKDVTVVFSIEESRGMLRLRVVKRGVHGAPLEYIGSCRDPHTKPRNVFENICDADFAGLVDRIHCVPSGSGGVFFDANVRVNVLGKFVLLSLTIFRADYFSHDEHQFNRLCSHLGQLSFACTLKRHNRSNGDPTSTMTWTPKVGNNLKRRIEQHK